MTQELKTRVKWRNGLKSYDCELIGGNTIKLQNENGEIIFELTKDQVTKVRIQQQYIYLNVGKKVHTVGVMPEAQYRIREKLSSGGHNAVIDEVTDEWRNYFDSSDGSAGGATNKTKVRRISAAGFVTITMVLVATNYVLRLSSNKNEQAPTSVPSALVQTPATTNTAAARRFVISGYSSNSMYTNRTPDWDGDVAYATYEEALDAGKKWQQSKGADSTVEIIQLLDSNTGQVVAVYDKNGLELIK